MRSDITMKQDDIDWKMTHDCISMYKWRDKRSVHLLSNYQNPAIINYVSRKQESGQIIDVTCPQAVLDNNANI